MIDRYQLRYFLAVMEAGNFTRAAARMNVTQPTLSIGIAKLEEALGAKLFFRNSQRVHLTEAGAQFLTRARLIENEFNRVEQQVAGLKPGRLIRLGVLSTIPTTLIERIVFLHAGETTVDRIELVDGSERDLLGRLDSGRLDVCLTLTRHGKTRYRSEPLCEEGYSLAVSRRHRLSDATLVQAEELAGEVMMVRRSCEVLSETSRYFTERGIRPEFAFRSLNDDKVLALVRSGLGVTVMPDSYIDTGISRPRLAGFDHRRQVGLLYADHAHDISESAFSIISIIRQVLEGHRINPEAVGTSS